MSLSPVYTSQDPLNTLSPSKRSELKTLLHEDMIPSQPNSSSSPDFEKAKTSSSENPNRLELFCVRWNPPIDKFPKFVESFRNITNIPLGGTRRSQCRYRDPTIAKVMSVGVNDSKSNLPQRVTLSNFKLGTPITSYGCICRHWNSELNEAEYLLIRRNNSVSYIELIHGTYRDSQLFFIIQDLPETERDRLLKYNFEELWEDLHLKSAEGDAYEYGQKIFSQIQPHLKALFEKFPSRDPSGKYLWLFPKGKSDYHQIEYYDGSKTIVSWEFSESDDKFIPESPFECALREFSEETNGLQVKEEDLKIEHPILEKYLGSNSKNYQTNYFIFETDKFKVDQFPRTEGTIREVSLGEVDQIKWVPYSQVDDYLCPARQKLLKHIESNLRSKKSGKVHRIWKCPAELSEMPIE